VWGLPASTAGRCVTLFNHMNDSAPYSAIYLYIVAMSTISKRSKTKLPAWHFFNIKAKQTWLIPKILKIKAKRTYKDQRETTSTYSRYNKDQSEVNSAYSIQQKDQSESKSAYKEIKKTKAK
jgi:hypothetical protein